MFKVDVASLEEYFAFDPIRRGDLEAFDRLMEVAAPRLERYFHEGTPAGTPGMRFKMIGYGRTKDERGVEWPLVGLALQKNYISTYLPMEAMESYRGRLGEKRMGRRSISFVRFDDLRVEAMTLMLAHVVHSWSSRLQS